MTGDELKALRKRRGWTQTQLVDLLNASLGKEFSPRSGQVGRWERGVRPVPADVAAFLDALDNDPEFQVFDGDRELPHEPIGDTPPPPPPGVEQTAATLAAVAGGGSYSRVCEELWELVATAVGMVGAVTGSEKLQQDGKIILADKQALGKAYGKLAEQNETFRNMLAGMTGGGAWLEVALVSGITAGKVMRNHQQPVPSPAPEPIVDEPGNGRMYGDGAVIDLPV